MKQRKVTAVIMQKLQNRGSITLKDVCENTSTSEVRCENETILSLKNDMTN